MWYYLVAIRTPPRYYACHQTYKFKMNWINRKREKMWSDLAEFQTHLCMSSLPVSMKRIPSRTTEKKWQHRFPNYNTICCHGQNFELIQAFMHVLIACKYEKDQMKNSGENVMTSFSPIISLWDFFQTLKGSQLRSPWSDLTEF